MVDEPVAQRSTPDVGHHGWLTAPGILRDHALHIPEQEPRARPDHRGMGTTVHSAVCGGEKRNRALGR